MKYLTIINKKGIRRVFLPERTITIGRTESNYIHLDDPKVSTLHCEISPEDDHYLVVDKNSTNGIHVNKKKVNFAKLKHGDIISIGNSEIQYLDPAKSAVSDTMFHVTPPSDISNYTIIDSKSLKIRENQRLTAIFKTTKLLNTFEELDTFLNKSLDMLVEEFGAQGGMIYRFEKKGSASDIIEQCRVAKKDSGSTIIFSLKAVNHVLETHNAFVTNDASKRKESSEITEEISIVCAPIYIGEEVYGVVYLYSAPPFRKFEPNDGMLFLNFTSLISIGLLRWQGIRMKDMIDKHYSKPVVDKLIGDNTNTKLQLGGERINATILFSDIRSFTKFAEQSSPEVTITMLNEYLSLMVRVIEKNGGVIDKFIGDAVLAVWGIQNTNPIQDAIQAVAATLEIRREMELLNAKRSRRGDPPIRIGIGLHSGEVIVGNIGSENRMEYTVIGHNVNVANRIESMTKEQNADILVTEQTLKLTEEFFDFVPTGAQYVFNEERKYKTYMCLSLKKIRAA